MHWLFVFGGIWVVWTLLLLMAGERQRRMLEIQVEAEAAGSAPPTAREVPIELS